MFSPQFCRAFAVYPLLTLTVPLAAQIPKAQVEAIRQAVTAEMARQQIPGVSIAIATGSELRWSEGFGMSDLENSLPARATTVYRLGSIAKPITAVAVLQLVEKNRIDLDAPIQKYLPQFPLKPWPITPRLLLGHLSGIRHYKNPEELNSTVHYDDAVTPLRIFAEDPLLFEPGTKYSYSSYGYNVLGAIVEVVSGEKFVDYLRKHIFRPSGLGTIAPDDVYALIPNRTRGYRLGKGGQIENCALADTSNKTPAGGLISTAEDLVKFALSTKSGLLVSAATVGQMFTSLTTKDGRRTGYGFGWGITERAGRKYVAHSGGQPGTSTYLMMIPAEGLAIAAMANREGADVVRLVNQVQAVLDWK